MTNTNDFRKYSYTNDTSYLINQFDFQRGSQAPRVKPDVQPTPDFKVRENTKFKSKAEIKREQKIAFRNAAMIMLTSVVFMVMIAGVLKTFALKNELTREIASQQVKIANAASENISLQSELDSLVSMSMIDKYAVEEFGMTKVKSNQIQYIDVNEYKVQREAKINKTPADAAKGLKSNK